MSDIVPHLDRAFAPLAEAVSAGRIPGAVLGIVRLRPQGNTDALRATLQTRLEPKELDGIISMHLLESDAKLSGPTKELPAAGNAGGSDWFVLIDGTSVSAVSSVLAQRFTGDMAPEGAMQISSGIYELMWDLAKSDIAAS